MAAAVQRPRVMRQITPLELAALELLHGQLARTAHTPTGGVWSSWADEVIGGSDVTAGDLAAANEPLRQAIQRFQKAYDEMPQRTWALNERMLAEELLTAIANGTHASLLSRWRDQTVANLKLDKLRT